MLIVLEGPDGNGKSTLIQQLYEDFGIPKYSSGGPKSKERMIEVLKELTDMAYSSTRYLVDRVPYISEPIYSKAFGRKPVMLKKILESYYRLPQKIIFCHIGDQKQALANMSREHKSHKPLEHLLGVEKNHSKITDLYENLMDDLEHKGSNIFEYDWTNPTHYPQLKEWIRA